MKRTEPLSYEEKNLMAQLEKFPKEEKIDILERSIKDEKDFNNSFLLKNCLSIVENS